MKMLNDPSRLAPLAARGSRPMNLCWSLLLLLGCSQEQHGIEHASGDDCEVIAEVGKVNDNWESGGRTQFVPDWPGYVEDCRWKTLGVSPLLSKAEIRETITRPLYTGDTATATFQLILPPGHGSFVYRHRCTLTRGTGHWKVQQCEIQQIGDESKSFVAAP